MTYLIPLMIYDTFTKNDVQAEVERIASCSKSSFVSGCFGSSAWFISFLGSDSAMLTFTSDALPTSSSSPSSSSSTASASSSSSSTSTSSSKMIELAPYPQPSAVLPPQLWMNWLMHRDAQGSASTSQTSSTSSRRRRAQQDDADQLNVPSVIAESRLLAMFRYLT